MIRLAAFLVLCATVSKSVDVDPTISTDAKGMVQLSVPNGICFSTGKSQNQSVQSPQSLRGPKGDRGDGGAAGRDGKDGRDGRDGTPGQPGTPGSNATCSQQSSQGAGAGFPLFQTPGPTWINLNRTTAPTVSAGDEVVGLVTYGMEKYYHGQVTSQYICRFENEAGDRLYSSYSPLKPYNWNTNFLNIGCKTPNATAWPTDKRVATVTVWFRNQTEIKYNGKVGDDKLTFETHWLTYSYTVQGGDVIIKGSGLNPNVTYTATFTWPNGTAISDDAQPDSFYTIIFNIKSHQWSFKGKQLVTIKISSASGTIMYKGGAGGDQVVLQEAPKHSACQLASYTLLTDAWRKKSNRDQSNVQCDQNILTPGWHRLGASIGGKLPETCVPTQSCGTHAPGWLQGTHPTVVGVEVSDTVCFHWSSNCCNWNAAVNIVNCGGYYVYNFRRTPACSLAYCGDL